MSWGGVTSSSCPQQYDTKPSAGIIAHGVGIISVHSVGVSLTVWAKAADHHGQRKTQTKCGNRGKIILCYSIVDV